MDIFTIFGDKIAAKYTTKTHHLRKNSGEDAPEHP